MLKSKILGKKDRILAELSPLECLFSSDLDFACNKPVGLSVYFSICEIITISNDDLYLNDFSSGDSCTPDLESMR